jgi:hypothetical protein
MLTHACLSTVVLFYLILSHPPHIDPHSRGYEYARMRAFVDFIYVCLCYILIAPPSVGFQVIKKTISLMCELKHMNEKC